jgi:hypothetical protein
VGLEPTTRCLKGSCSNQLSYGPAIDRRGWRCCNWLMIAQMSSFGNALVRFGGGASGSPFAVLAFHKPAEEQHYYRQAAEEEEVELFEVEGQK